MADRKIRELVRKFEGGDTEAGARLAREMMRSAELLTLVGALSEELQRALSAQTVGEKLKAEIAEAVAEGMDADEIAESVAGNLDYYSLASEVSVYEIASEISTSDIAYELDSSDIAEHLDLEDVAEHVACSGTLTEEVARQLDMDSLADLVAEKLESRLQELVEEAVG